MLANRAYWLMHHDVTGALQTSKRAADRVVAAAILAELIGQGVIGVESDRVLVFTPAPRLDGLGAAVRELELNVCRCAPRRAHNGEPT